MPPAGETRRGIFLLRQLSDSVSGERVASVRRRVRHRARLLFSEKNKFLLPTADDYAIL